MRYNYEGQGLDWFELVNFIDQLDAQIAIDSLDIRSRGNLTHSVIAQAEVTVAVTSETTRRQAATTFPALGGPVRHRKIETILHYADLPLRRTILLPGCGVRSGLRSVSSRSSGIPPVRVH